MGAQVLQSQGGEAEEGLIIWPVANTTLPKSRKEADGSPSAAGSGAWRQLSHLAWCFSHF